MKMEGINMFMERIKKGWNELEEEVIEAGKCVYCGACGAFCDDVKFDKDTEKPYDDGSCEEKNTCKDGYGVCYNLCPKTGIESFPVNLLDKWVFEKEHDNILGHYKRIVSVKLTEKGKSIIKDKEAGPLTALLATAMAEKEIDCAIVNKHDKKFRPVPYLAEKIDQLSNSTGYKPSQAPTLSLVGDAINQGFTDIAVVGTPCQMHALRKLQNHPRFDYEAYDLISLAIGTFCFGTFHNKQLNQILEEYQIRPEDITKVERDEKNFNLNFYTNGELTSIPLNKVYDYSIRKACFACSDYTSSFADIAVGNVGSDPNWDTLIIRNNRGNEIVQLAVDNELIEIKEMLKDKKETILDITRRKCDIVEIERIQEHSKTIKSFWLRDSRIAKAYRPGNFVVLWIPDIDFLPMSVSQIEGDLLEITVEKVGEGT
jgi:coenzyme F420 hydrogenase subunit beta